MQLHGGAHESGDGCRRRCGERRGDDGKRMCVDRDREPQLGHDNEWGQRHRERHGELYRVLYRVGEYVDVVSDGHADGGRPDGHHHAGGPGRCAWSAFESARYL